jgi:hypothetical protein
MFRVVLGRDSRITVKRSHPTSNDSNFFGEQTPEAGSSIKVVGKTLPIKRAMALVTSFLCPYKAYSLGIG